MRIIYIDIDTQRADHLGCYGYHRDTSPNIDRLATEGVRCDNVYCSDAPCLPSRSAFYSGRLGIQTGVVGHGGTAAEPKRTGTKRDFKDSFTLSGLASQLRRRGMHAAMISPFGDRHSAHWFYAGFNEIHNTGKSGMEIVDDVEPVLERWLDRHVARDDWYLHLNLWDPHTPYRTPESYGNPFKDDPLPEWITDEVLEEHKKKTGPHSALDPGMYTDADSPDYPRVPDRIDSREKLRRWIDGYDVGVRYVDDAVGRIIDKLKAEGVYDQTAIIISADHAENQGELGIYGEHGTADQGTCRIPLIIKWPGGANAAVDEALHYHLDLAPTLMDLLGGEKPEIWDGRSFASTIKADAPSDPTRDDLVLSQCCHVCQRSVRWQDGDGDWLYIRTYHDGFHLFPQEMLFELGADPYEQTDLAPDQPQRCMEGAWRLTRWHDAQMQKMARNTLDLVDPLWTVIADGGPHHARHAPPTPLPAYLKRLRETGRADGAEALSRKYARFL